MAHEGLQSLECSHVHTRENEVCETNMPVIVGCLFMSGTTENFCKIVWATVLLDTCLLVEGLGELVDWWRDLQPGLEDGLLPLETDVLGPLDEVGQVTLGLQVLPDPEGLWPLLEQGVRDPLDLGLLDGQGGGRDLLSLLVLWEESLGSALVFQETGHVRTRGQGP